MMSSESKKNKKRSFKIRIIQVFFLLILITVFGLSFLFYNRSTDIILDLTDDIVQEVTSKTIDRTTNYIGVPAAQTKALSHMVTDANIINNHQEIWRFAWEQLLVFEQIQSMFVADMNGSYVQVRREPRFATRYIDRSIEEPIEKWWYRNEDYSLIETTSKKPNFDPRIRPWFINTKADPKIYWTDVYVFTTAQTPGISASYPVVDDEGNLIAVTVLNSPLHSLSNFLAKQKITKNAAIFITNAKNELIAYPKVDYTSRIDDKSGKRRLSYVSELSEKWITDAFKTYRDRSKNLEIIEKRRNASWFSVMLQIFAKGRIPSEQEVFHYPKRNFSVSATNGETFITYSAPFPKSFASKWEIIIVVPEDDLIAPLNELRKTGLITAFLFMIFSLLVVYYIISTLTKPIMKLAAETTKISRFDLDDIGFVNSSIKEVDVMNKALTTATTGLQSFKKYVPAVLVRQLIELGKEVKLGGDESDMTIFFSDIANFTSISEKMLPDELMSHLSTYLDELSKIIMAADGTIDKYIGDSIMAFWGAPVKQENSAHLACKAALDCQKKLTELNDKWQLDGKFPLETRMGIHSGKTIVGNLGSTDRMNYTIIGNSTNLASRLEGINKLYGTKIIISEDTYRRVSSDFFCRLLDYVSVKGQEKGYKLYELIDDADAVIDEQKKEFCKQYEYAFQAYLNKDLGTAVKVLTQLKDKHPNDKSVLFVLNRWTQLRRAGDREIAERGGAFHISQK